MSEQCPQCGSIIRRLDDGTLERSQGTVSRAYVAQDENGGWYGDAGNVMQESDPERTREQAQAWVIERLNTVAERPCAIYQDYREWLREAHKAKQELTTVQAEAKRLQRIERATRRYFGQDGTIMVADWPTAMVEHREALAEVMAALKPPTPTE